MKSQVKYKVVGPVDTNCYLLINVETNEAVVIDPGARGEFIAERIKELGYKVDTVLLTHGHFDHMSGLKSMREVMELKVYVGENEKDVLSDPEANCSYWLNDGGFSEKADSYVHDGDILKVAGFDIKCLATPGHTIGGICYYIESEKLLFSGDTVFCQSVGRTDLPTGSSSELLNSIREKIKNLPGDTKVYPGHGEETTIADELRYNPYFNV